LQSNRKVIALRLQNYHITIAELSQRDCNTSSVIGMQMQRDCSAIDVRFLKDNKTIAKRSQLICKTIVARLQ
jgi:uncharacterized protein YlxP (DUF503 family)